MGAKPFEWNLQTHSQNLYKQSTLYIRPYRILRQALAMVCWNCDLHFTPAERIIKRSGRSCLDIVCTAHPMVYIRSLHACVCVCGGGVKYLSISMCCF